MELRAEHVVTFLTHLAVDQAVSASTQNQACSAILFPYRVVLGQDLGPIEHVPRLGRPTVCRSY